MQNKGINLVIYSITFIGLPISYHGQVAQGVESDAKFANGSTEIKEKLFGFYGWRSCLSTFWFHLYRKKRYVLNRPRLKRRMNVTLEVSVADMKI